MTESSEWSRQKTDEILIILLKNSELLRYIEEKFVTNLLRKTLDSRFCTLDQSVHITKLIVMTGADVSILDQALLQGDLQLTETLLKKGFSLSGPEWDDYSPAQYIFRLNRETNKDMLLLLLRYGLDAGFRNKDDENLLYLLTENAYEEHHDTLEMAKILIDLGVPVNEISKNLPSQFITPLFNSVYVENFKLTSFLIENGAEVNNNVEMLLMAVQRGVETVDLLLSTGVDVNVKSVHKSTMLHDACYCNNEPVIKLLISKGAMVSVEDEDGATPFSLLDVERDSYDECVVAIMKKISTLVVENISVCKKDKDLIQANFRARKHLEKCIGELKLMKSTRFQAGFSYYSVFKKTNVKKIALLTKNEEIVSKFENNLGQFSYYGEDLKEILKEAVQVRDNLDAVYGTINPVFRNIFPDVVLRKLTHILALKDLPLL